MPLFFEARRWMGKTDFYHSTGKSEYHLFYSKTIRGQSNHGRWNAPGFTWGTRGSSSILSITGASPWPRRPRDEQDLYRFHGCAMEKRLACFTSSTTGHNSPTSPCRREKAGKAIMHADTAPDAFHWQKEPGKIRSVRGSIPERLRGSHAGAIRLSFGILKGGRNLMLLAAP